MKWVCFKVSWSASLTPAPLSYARERGRQLSSLLETHPIDMTPQQPRRQQAQRVLGVRGVVAIVHSCVPRYNVPTGRLRPIVSSVTVSVGAYH